MTVEVFKSSFLFQVPTPVVNEDPVISLSKIKEEMKEFLSYGNKFMNDIHDCLMVTDKFELLMQMSLSCKLASRK